jgi:hypothetical protein
MSSKAKRDSRRVASLKRLAADQAATPAEKRAARGRVAAIAKRTKTTKPTGATKPSAMTADLQEDFVRFLIVLQEGAAGNRIDGLTMADRAEYLLTRAAGRDPGPRIAMPGALLAAHLDDAPREMARFYFDRRYQRSRNRLEQRLHLGPVSLWGRDGFARGKRAMERAAALHAEAEGLFYSYLQPGPPVGSPAQYESYAAYLASRPPAAPYNAERDGPQVGDNHATAGKALPTKGRKALPAAPAAGTQTASGVALPIRPRA